MDSSDDFLTGYVLPAFKIGALIALTLLLALLHFGVLYLIYFCLTISLRRAERARLFIDLLADTFKQGRPLEETVISLAQIRDLSMGVRFHLLAACLESGQSLDQALVRVRGFLPPPIVAMLAAGRLLGNVARVLPACRQVLKDATSQTWGAMNYLIILTLVITPSSIFLYFLMMIFVVPKVIAISEGMDFLGGRTCLLFLSAHFPTLIGLQIAMLLLVWLVALIFIGGPWVPVHFSFLERLQYLLPWRRRRMQRDFSTMLALLLDGGLPEPAALTLAADCSANAVFRRRAARAVVALQQGSPLPEAVRLLDDSGEFHWRLSNAAAASGGFFRTLAGWHDHLDARAFQQEQAVAHLITTGLVLWSGAFVGFIFLSVFMFLIALINQGVLW